MKDEDQKRIVDVLGDEAAAFDSDQLGAATAKFLEDATAYNAELSGSVVTLTEQVTNLSAAKNVLEAQVTELSNKKPADTIELSASHKAALNENALHRIDAIGNKQGWSAATISGIKAKLAGDAINLSAGTDGEVAQTISLSTMLDVLAEQPVQGIVPGERTDVLTLSRTASDDGKPVTTTDNPLLDIAKGVR